MFMDAVRTPESRLADDIWSFGIAVALSFCVHLIDHLIRDIIVLVASETAIICVHWRFL